MPCEPCPHFIKMGLSYAANSLVHIVTFLKTPPACLHIIIFLLVMIIPWWYDVTLYFGLGWKLACHQSFKLKQAATWTGIIYNSNVLWLPIPGIILRDRAGIDTLLTFWVDWALSLFWIFENWLPVMFGWTVWSTQDSELSSQEETPLPDCQAVQGWHEQECCENLMKYFLLVEATSHLRPDFLLLSGNWASREALFGSKFP